IFLLCINGKCGRGRVDCYGGLKGSQFGRFRGEPSSTWIASRTHYAHRSLSFVRGRRETEFGARYLTHKQDNPPASSPGNMNSEVQRKHLHRCSRMKRYRRRMVRLQSAESLEWRL